MIYRVPVIMSRPTILSLLAGNKTQTRRAPNPTWAKVLTHHGNVDPVWLWVRESVRWEPTLEHWIYMADGSRVAVEADPPDRRRSGSKPAIHMPKHWSRLSLEVTDVRAQRLWDINENDSLAEGIEAAPGGFRDPIDTDIVLPYARSAFRRLWDSVQGKNGAFWWHNPEVVALTFNVHHRNILSIEDLGDRHG